jgi:branched-chain amino acid aminotransferase
MNRVWLNGALLPAAAARIDPADRGFTLGDGVFETILALAGTPRHLDLHLARLRQGACVLGIDIPYADAMLGEALATVANGADAALRVTLTRGPMARGVLPTGMARSTLLITAGALQAAPPPARVMIAQITRRNEYSPLAAIKSLNYGDNILARQEAARFGFDDALLLNTRGNLAEATAANLFLLIGNQWVTPPVADGALPGIRRALIVGRGHAQERTIAGSDILRAKAGFLANVLATRMLACIGDLDLDVRQTPCLEI